LKTNKPLYMDSKYQLTYDDSAAPSHYGWQQSARFEQIERALQAAMKGETPPPQRRSVSDERVRKIMRDLDDQGRWVSTYSGERLIGQPKFADKFRYLSSEVFCRNIETLRAYVASPRK
jgi:hypothetical protein